MCKGRLRALTNKLLYQKSWKIKQEYEEKVKDEQEKENKVGDFSF